MRLLSALLLFTLSACASLTDRTRESLDQPGLEGTRWGLVVTTLDGRELIAINPDQRFLPASNTKLFTVAAAFHTLGDMTQPDPARGTSLRLITAEGGPPALFLVGAGDPTLIDAPDCERNCLSSLADAVLSNGITEVDTIVADETLYSREPWPPGWSLDDIVTRSGEPVSALTVNSNEVTLVVTPGPQDGAQGEIAYRSPPELYDIDNHVDTIAADSELETLILAERIPGDTAIRVYGRIKAGAPPLTLPVAVHDPAWAAAMRLSALLEARGVTVTDGIEARYRPLKLYDATTTEFTSRRPGVEIARLVPAPLIDNVTFLNKQSQNLHAELLLRRVGLATGDGSREAGLAVVETMLAGHRHPALVVGPVRWLRHVGLQPRHAAHRRHAPALDHAAALERSLPRHPPHRRRRRHAAPPLRRHKPRRPHLRQDRHADGHDRALRLPHDEKRPDADLLRLRQRASPHRRLRHRRARRCTGYHFGNELSAIAAFGSSQPKTCHGKRWA